MLLRVTALIGQEGASIPFTAGFDWQDAEVNRQFPLAGPVTFEGTVRNAAGMLVLAGEISTLLQWTCDRCAVPFTEPYTGRVAFMLAEELTDEENDEIYLLKDDCVDLADAAFTALLFDVGMKVLCDEDCRGLCQQCGQNLNKGRCACPREPADPRWAALQQLIMDSE
jgi:uncharacterized protein